MAERGQPQQLEAVEFSAQGAQRLLFPSLYEPELDFRPASIEQALEGYGGDFRPVASVSHNSDDFQAALQACRATVESDESAAIELEQILVTVYDHYVESFLDDDFERIVGAWRSCMAEAGFTVVDEAAFGEMRLPQAYGVEQGRWSPPLDEPQWKELAPGEVLVYRSPASSQYLPTDAEVGLARADVACKAQVDMLAFVRSRWADVVDDARRSEGARIADLVVRLTSSTASMTNQLGIEDE